jgi:hypothetical protein
VGPEPLFEELGHRVKAVPDVERQEDPEQGIQPEHDGGPFAGRQNKPAPVGGSGLRDELMAAEVRGNDAAPDEPPWQLVARKEVVALAAPGLARGVHPERNHHDHIQHEDADIYPA